MAKSIYVGNLPFETTGEELALLFRNFGTVTRGEVITDRFSGRSRGFGLVEMPSDEEADARDQGSERASPKAAAHWSSTRPVPRATVAVGPRRGGRERYRQGRTRPSQGRQQRCRSATIAGKTDRCDAAASVPSRPSPIVLLHSRRPVLPRDPPATITKSPRSALGVASEHAILLNSSRFVRAWKLPRSTVAPPCEIGIRR